MSKNTLQHAFYCSGVLCCLLSLLFDLKQFYEASNLNNNSSVMFSSKPDIEGCPYNAETSKEEVKPLLENDRDLWTNTTTTSTTTTMTATRPDFQRHIFWLHIPKTGTSFFNTIYLNLCPRVLEKFPQAITAEKLFDHNLVKKAPPTVYCPKLLHPDRPGFHYPFQPRTFPRNTTVFTMLRDPKIRLLSAFHFGRHGSQNQNTTMAEYLQEPQIANCQIKMVLGHRCYMKVDPSLLNVDKAIQRITSEHFFMGITDRWDESICLFHAWYGGSTQPFELRNNRPTTKKEQEVENSTQDLDQYSDLDFKLFSRATQVFEARLKEANCLAAAAAPLPTNSS